MSGPKSLGSLFFIVYSGLPLSQCPFVPVIFLSGYSHFPFFSLRSRVSVRFIRSSLFPISLSSPALDVCYRCMCVSGFSTVFVHCFIGSNLIHFGVRWLRLFLKEFSCGTATRQSICYDFTFSHPCPFAIWLPIAYNAPQIHFHRQGYSRQFEELIPFIHTKRCVDVL